MAKRDTAAKPGTRGGERSPTAGPADPKERMSRYALLPLRLFLGATFLYAGLDKLASAHYLAGAADPASFVAQAQAAEDAAPTGLLLDLALRAPTPVALAMAFGELAVGLGSLLGLWTRLAALGGALISLGLWLTVSWHVAPYYLGNDLAYLLAWTPLLLAGAPLLSLDALLARRSARARAAGAAPSAVRRRMLIDGGVAAVAVAGIGLLTGSLARLGRRDRVAAGPSPTGTATPSTGPSTGAQADVATAASVSVADVAVGGAARTTDPATGDTVYVLQPEQGRYTALSAVCPHAGCVVNAPEDGKLACPCHNSQFDAATGALLHGPATSGLARYGITRSGDRLQLGDKES